MLGSIGHDLELLVEDYLIELDEAGLQVAAEFSAASLRVVDAVEGRELRPGKLSHGDKLQIERNLADAVLEAAKHPKITFRAASVEPRASGYRIQGALRLHGRERALDFLVRREHGELSAEIELHQPDFGIKPFRALGGALRVRPEVLVCIALDPQRGDAA